MDHRWKKQSQVSKYPAANGRTLQDQFAELRIFPGGKETIEILYRRLKGRWIDLVACRQFRNELCSPAF